MGHTRMSSRGPLLLLLLLLLEFSATMTGKPRRHHMLHLQVVHVQLNSPHSRPYHAPQPPLSTPPLPARSIWRPSGRLTG